MLKRPRDQEDTHFPPKRAKSEQYHQPPVVEEIHFARQLQRLLTFSQDGIQHLRNGIASFKAFLESILYHKEESDRARQLSILREYLDSQKPIDIKDSERPFLGQIWQAWSFANENNNDHLSSSISSILALLLKTLSTLLDFRDHGILLCRTALQHQHLRLVKRCIDAPKHKDFLISPCLRLLIEVTSFDGGVLAREVYKRREQTFDLNTLRRNLGLYKTDISQEEASRRPAIRTLTIKYIVAQLKYVHEGGKIDILKSRPICASLFHFVRDDPPDIINELLSMTEQYVLKDNELPRSAKAALLVQQNLERVTDIATRSEDGHAAAERAFAWLKSVCTNSSYGVLRTSSWYPPGTGRSERGHTDDSAIDLGLDSIEFYDQEDRPNVRNTTLLSWTQTLRPHANAHERELILTCFTSAPELVAAYFAEKHMQLEPKLSNTWMGYAAFLFEVIRLPVPTYLGNEKDWAELPPQSNILIENILPRPLTQKVLARCLNQSSELITFFAVRLLVLAFEKLAQVQTKVAKAAVTPNGRKALWQEASERLLERFVERSPNVKDVINAFRKVPDDDDHALQREAVTRLLRLFYDVLPLQAMEEQFDIAVPLTAALARSDANQGSGELQELRKLELQHLLHIARHSLGMRWFSKQGSLEYSPIVTLLMIHSKDFSNRHTRELIYHVLSENNIVNNNKGCDALVALLSETDDHTNIGPFLDDCIARLARQPIKYLDYHEAVARGTTPDEDSATTASYLALVFLEQAPFVLTKPKAAKESLEAWLNTFIQLSTHCDSNSKTSQEIGYRFGELDGFAWERGKCTDPEGMLNKVRLDDLEAIEERQMAATEISDVAITFEMPPTESDSHPELSKWAQKDLDIAIEDGDVTALILCLCSQYNEIRTQALTQLYKLENKLLHSSMDDKDPVYILLGELIETYEYHCLPKATALPYLVGCFATHALQVQMEPINCMYPKINRFLNKGPHWRMNKLPTYWIENTILSLPEEDDAYWKEVQWTLDWIVDGLRTSADLEILRKTSVFEKMMSLASSPGAGAHKLIHERVLELVWRATCLDGGSTTLVTRTGVLGWLDLVKTGDKSLEHALKERILKTCDRDKIQEWSGMRLEEL